MTEILIALIGALSGIISAISAHRIATKKNLAEMKVLKLQAEDLKNKNNKMEFVVRNLVNGPGFYFLEHFGQNNGEYIFRNNYRDKEHLREIRDKNFIRKIGNKNINDLKDGDNLFTFFEIEPLGAKYLQMVHQYDASP